MGAAMTMAFMAGISLPVHADAPALPASVTADGLPTWQINGVVWSQTVIGNTVYVTGSFTKARPPGVPVGGAGEIDALNIFAFDITTGNRVPFDHSLNAQGLVIRGAPDGKRLYVGGDFSAVDGQARGHLAAFDLTAAGTPLVSGFAPHTDGQVRGFGFAGSTIYVGGNFRSANGQPRDLLAAFDTGSGAMSTTWTPSVDGGYVWAMVMSPDLSRVIVAGSFTTLNGLTAYGMGSLNSATGANEAWAANSRIKTAGNDGAIASLSTDGAQVYGSGYAFGAGAAFEGTFAADPYTGDIKWVNDCLGDSYDTFPSGQVLYSVSHRHNCTVVGGFPDTSPRSRWQKATAEPTFPVGIITSKDAYGWDYTGLPYAGLLHWYPDLEFGTYTSARQAAWSVTGNADYVVLGGEFPIVNGMAQQGLVRFTKRPNPPHAMGPINNTVFTPAPTSRESGKVRVIFGSVWDRDDTAITYDVFRQLANTSTVTKIATFTRTDSEFWKLPYLSYVDTGQAPGTSIRYQVRAKDTDGNVQWSAWSPYVTVSSAAPAPYLTAVQASGATHLWRLGEAAGTTTLLDSIGDLHGANVSMTLGAAGAVPSDTAVTSPGGSTAKVTMKDALPSDAAVSVEAWVKTTSIRGGRIVGFGDSATGTSTSGNTDRVLYLDNSGRPNFAINNGAYRTIYGRTGINDGQWHHVVGTVDAAGMQLFVDGVRVGRDQTPTNPMSYTGYWRIGADQTSGFTNRPTDTTLAGTIDEVAVYPKAIAKADVQAHYLASGRSSNWSAAPTDTYGAKVAADQPDLYWRLGEASGSALDSSSSGSIGNVTGGVVRGQVGAVGGTDTAASFDGINGQVTAQQSWSSPSAYSTEVWFKTTSTKGGKLIGFGNTTSGLSASYDRHVYMYSNGKLSFGVNNGAQTSLVTAKSYNDGQWHHVVATQGTEGMRLWVDTTLVGSNTVTGAQSYLGYWRAGGDRTWGNTTSNYITGALDEVAVYARALTEKEVRDHYTASGRTAINRPPTAAFTTQVDDLKLTVDGATSSDPDGPIASYTWDFGDGTSGSGVTATHTYSQGGTYSVQLTVADGLGATNSSSRSVTVTPNQSPTAAFTSSVQDLKVSLDASTSDDPDGTIASYSWDFGDGATGSGKTDSHTYAQSGTYNVRLTVTDNDGASGSITHDVRVVEPPNEPPAARFTTSVRYLKVTVDGSGSTDPDGSIASYSWDYGDGATGTGETDSHTYTTSGTYTVRLTVTDDRSGTNTVSHDVVVVANQEPHAAFTSDISDLTVTTDGSGSTDADGSIESYAWDFGDGTTGTSRSASHAYTTPGEYTIRLTVTDDGGAKDSVEHQVTVSNPTHFARDDFERSVSSGWGTADRGGIWTIPSGATKFSVSGGTGKVSLAAGAGYTASLASVSSSDTDLKVSVSIDKAATGGGQYVSLIGRQRQSPAVDYRGKVRIASNGAVSIWLVKTEGGAETVLGSTTVAGLTYAAGETLNLRLQASGTSPTSLKVKAWKSGSSEPTAWTLSASDSTAALQSAGSIGLYSFLSGSATNGPVVLSYDSLWAGPTG
jgi:PKD repeat protein